MTHRTQVSSSKHSPPYSDADPAAGAAIEVALPATTRAALRNAVFAGLRTKQLEVCDGAVRISGHASAGFVSELAAAAGEPILLTPSITHRALDGSTRYVEKTVVSVAEYLRELRDATIAIDKKYAQVGGLLGAPISDIEFGGKNYEVPYRKYERGAIYVTLHGTHEVHGAIYQKYAALGAEASFLGFPETDELGTVLGSGRFSHFQRGSIYWSQSTGAWSITGGMRDRWLQMNAERSYLGFPVSDVEQGANGSMSFFQHGIIVQDFEGVFHDYPDAVRFLTELAGGNVKCSTEFGMNSRGEWFFRGHMHNDGFAGNNTVVATSPMFVDSAGGAFAVTADRSLGGTLDKEDRNDDWDQMGANDFIRDNWEYLQYAGVKTVMKTNVTVGDVLHIVLPAVAIVGAAIFGGDVAANNHLCPGQSSMKRDPRTGETQGRFGFSIVPNGEPCPPAPPTIPSP